MVKEGHKKGILQLETEKGEVQRQAEQDSIQMMTQAINRIDELEMENRQLRAENMYTQNTEQHVMQMITHRNIGLQFLARGLSISHEIRMKSGGFHEIWWIS